MKTLLLTIAVIGYASVSGAVAPRQEQAVAVSQADLEAAINQLGSLDYAARGSLNPVRSTRARNRV
jgi:hypothetical protein